MPSSTGRPRLAVSSFVVAPTTEEDRSNSSNNEIYGAFGDSNGGQGEDDRLPASAASLPPAARVFGRLLAARTLNHSNICAVVDVLKGKRDRIFVVAEYHEEILENWMRSNGGTRSLPILRAVAFQLLSALVQLHSQGVVLGNLTPSRVLLAPSSTASPSFPYILKLSADCFLAHATRGGREVGFPVTDPSSSPPQWIRLRGLLPLDFTDACAGDVWALGILLLELYTGQSPFFLDKERDRRSVDPETDLAKVRAQLETLSLLKPNDQGIASGYPALDAFFADPGADLHLVSFLSQCLTYNPRVRAPAEELYSHPFLEGYPTPLASRTESLAQVIPEDPSHLAKPDPLEDLDLGSLFHLWRLAGGDLETELSRTGALAFSPAVSRVPRSLRLGAEPKDSSDYMFASRTLDPSKCYSRLVAVLPTQSLESRLAHVAKLPPFASLPPLELGAFTADPPSASLAESGRTVAQLERDPVYQRALLSRWTRLLSEWPASRADIKKAARAGIPPLLRGRIWCALLEIPADPSIDYARFSAVNVEADTDRQLDLDIPRCHQYDDRMATPLAHGKLKRVLRAWLAAEQGKMVYWQGLDSVAASFLSVCFEDEASAFACLKSFVGGFLGRFFVHDNSTAIQEYMTSFRHILSYHDPLLSTYCDKIGLVPDLYAIPWFMTLFAHVFSLGKVYHLYDRILVGPPAMPLCVGVGVLRQMRDKLLQRDFNDCMLLFSDLPDTIEIDACLDDAARMLRFTPPSFLPPDLRAEPLGWGPEDEIPPAQRKKELVGRMAIEDFRKVAADCVVLDVRADESFLGAHLVKSFGASGLPNSLQPLLPYLRAIADNGQHLTVIGDEESDGIGAAEALVRAGFGRVSLLSATFDDVAAGSGGLGLCPCEGVLESFGQGNARAAVRRCEGIVLPS